MKRTSVRLLVATVCVAVGAGAIKLGRPVPERPAASVLDAGSRASRAPLWRTRVDTLRRGEPLLTVLERAGVPRGDATRALQAASSLDARKIRAGTTITTRALDDSAPSEIIFQLAIDRLLRISRSASSWTEREERLAWTTDTVGVDGVVQSTLIDAVERAASYFPTNKRIEIAYALADILEYRVDLSRDLQKGDTIRVLLERQRAANGLVRPGNILVARLTVDGRRVETVRFGASRDGATVQKDAPHAEYFDGDGKSMRAEFLRAPVAFRRISSVFGLRKHPILGIWRAHEGTDYAASAGTPVRAIGDGMVIFAGWKGGYGRLVEIRHRNGVITRYGHLQSFAAGIRAGVPVHISNTIGHVGQTGLATAPHLHFEVLIGGVHKDPRYALKSSSGVPLAASDRSAFADLKTRLFARLDSVIAGTPFVAQDARNNGVRGDAARHMGVE